MFPRRCGYRLLIRGAIENGVAGQFWNRPNTILRKRRARRRGSRLGNGSGLRIRWVSQISSPRSLAISRLRIRPPYAPNKRLPPPKSAHPASITWHHDGELNSLKTATHNTASASPRRSPALHWPSWAAAWMAGSVRVYLTQIGVKHSTVSP